MTAFHLSEPCCGTGALTLSFIPGAKLLVPFQGNKWRRRKQLQALITERGFTELHSCQLNDAGPWGSVWSALVRERDMVLFHLHGMAKRDPREVFDSLQRSPAPTFFEAARFAAEFLFLQRVAYSGKAVQVRDGLWVSPGFNRNSAYGCEGTERFGPIYPMVPALIRNIEGMPSWGWPTARRRRKGEMQPPPAVAASYADALELSPARLWYPEGKVTQPESVLGQVPIVVYLDPPYAEGTRFPGVHLTREQVVLVALRWHLEYGAYVLVSEAEPVAELVEVGWEARELRGATPQVTSPFRSKRPEWVTMSPKGEP